MIKALIFDYDGTLSNRSESVYRFYSDHLNEYLSDLSDYEKEALLQDLLYYDANGIEGYEYRLSGFMALHEDLFPKDLAQDFVKIFREKIPSYNVLKEETIEVLKSLKDRYRMAVLSNGGSMVQHEKIAYVGIEEYFDEVIVSGDVGIHKPDPKLFEYVLEKLGVKAQETLMVGDVFATDILGAYRAGIKTVWLVEDEERPAFIYKGYRIRNLIELPAILERENNEHTDL